MVAEEEGPRHEPYVDASSHGTGGGIANQDNVNSKSGTDETMDTGDETCYYYMAGSGEVYYVDPNAATQEDGLQMEEEEKEEVAAEREQQAEEGNLELAECQGEKGVEGDEEDEQQFIEGAQNEKDQGHREEQNEKEYQEQIMIKGKVVKALVREESKARKRLQEDSMLVLADIGRTYRGMARCVTTPAKAEKALRHAAKKLEKEATKQGHAMEAEWKKEVMEINRTFRAEMEAEAKRAKKALKSS
ncbi:hypothetical protein DQ04_14571000 [Trypanosoma grayi]|uniref:hypothetical protein n=1 Tax=Trypanosoma grayi TaxID=71804 RepID=UPI0004F4808D|nr:hypothetical protein DQ04_14571000 [Trypanosoma grayi]KEG06333.1 hypothetical protein DQ04_14571000 [Trypanosoma grayi]